MSDVWILSLSVLRQGLADAMMDCSNPNVFKENKISFQIG